MTVCTPGENDLPIVTGKPVDMSGSRGRSEATARGCLFATERLVDRGVVPSLESLDGARVAVPGFGNARPVTAKLFPDIGATGISVSYLQRGVDRDDCQDLDATILCKAKNGTVAGMSGKTRIITSSYWRLATTF